MRSMVRGIIAAAALALGSFVGTAAIAQSYPNKPIHVVVPWPPGAADVFVRELSKLVSDAKAAGVKLTD